jgi:hypothetical protein
MDWGKCAQRHRGGSDAEQNWFHCQNGDLPWVLSFTVLRKSSALISESSSGASVSNASGSMYGIVRALGYRLPHFVRMALNFSATSRSV